MIKDLSDLYHDLSFNESLDYDHEYLSDYQDQYDQSTITDEIDITTVINDDKETVTTTTTTNAEDEVTHETSLTETTTPVTETTTAVTDTTSAVKNTLAVTDATLTVTTTVVTDTAAVTELVNSVEAESLLLLQRSNNLTQTDMSVLSALLELEQLRGAQQDMEDQIEEKVNQLELLLENNGTRGTQGTNIPHIEDLRRPKFIDQKARGGKTLDISGKKKTIESSVNLFANLQAQLFSVLDARHKILQDVSEKVNQELAVFQQTVDFLQRLVNFKLDQGRDKCSNLSQPI